MREILPRLLWIGNARDARDFNQVLDLGITAVIDLAREEPPISYPREIVYCRLLLIDGDENQTVVLPVLCLAKLSNISVGLAW